MNTEHAETDTSAQMWQLPATVGEWLIRQGREVALPVTIGRVGFGQSNITTLIVDAIEREWVMREPPPGTSTETAHDVEREAAILRSLAPSSVPVPEVIASGRSRSGSPFFVMEKVPGKPLETEDDVRTLTPDQRRELGLSVAATLAQLHNLNPGALGLRSSSRPYAVRQMRRMAELWDRFGNGSAHASAWHAVHSALTAQVPPTQRPVIMHGDYRLSNLLVCDGAITAVLDWELCTIGDPLADLAWLLDDWRAPEEPAIVMPSPTRAGGFPDRDEMVGVYSDLTGINVNALDYYRAFSQWRAASLLQGVLVRRQQGLMGGHGAVDPDDLGSSIGALLTSASTHLGQAS
jgi:aminoglycoside phosphotransferase (APT) family kinase protein